MDGSVTRQWSVLSVVYQLVPEYCCDHRSGEICGCHWNSLLDAHTRGCWYLIVGNVCRIPLLRITDGPVQGEVLRFWPAVRYLQCIASPLLCWLQGSEIRQILHGMATALVEGAFLTTLPHCLCLRSQLCIRVLTVGTIFACVEAGRTTCKHGMATTLVEGAFLTMLPHCLCLRSQLCIKVLTIVTFFTCIEAGRTTSKRKVRRFISLCGSWSAVPLWGHLDFVITVYGEQGF
jgi:hypothetical protein